MDFKSLKMLPILLCISILFACAKEEEEEETTTNTTTITINCQKELASCNSASATANGKTAFIYYLDNNCVTLTPKTSGVTSTNIVSWAKVTLTCSTNGCTGTTTTWYNTSDTQITNPPASGTAGNRSYFSFIDLNSSATDTDGLNGLQLSTDAVSDCSDISGTTPYGSHSLGNFSI